MRDARWVDTFSGLAATHCGESGVVIGYFIGVVTWLAGGVASSGALRLEYERLHLAATMAARRHPLRNHILTLFRRGDLVSVYEAVLICDASRQAITKWLKAEGISVEANRLAHLARLRARAQEHVDRRPGDQWISAKRRRRETKQAVRRFNAANATDQGQS